MRFVEKVVIVTGGASGIGEEAVRLFAAEGAKVVIADFSDRGAEVSGKLNEEGLQTAFVKTDVTREADVQYSWRAMMPRSLRAPACSSMAVIPRNNLRYGVCPRLTSWEQRV